jgi:hypothetical protein
MARPLYQCERDALKKGLLESLPRNYGFVLQSARECGVDVKTARRLIDDDEDLQAAVAAARQDTQDELGHLVASVGMGKKTIPTSQVTPMIFAAKVLGGLSEQTRVEHGGRVEWSPPPGVKTDSESPDAADGPPLLSLLKSAGSGSNET